ncbi:MAG: transposase [Candidatus Thorarchaeota archaeon]|nr:transposase [Candidatus Thorarchaeota archaeon]
MTTNTRRRSREQMTSKSQHQTMDDNYHYPSSTFLVQKFSLNSFDRVVARKGLGRRPDSTFTAKNEESDIDILQDVLKNTGRKCSDTDLSTLNLHFDRFTQAVNTVLTDIYSHPIRAQKIGEKLSASRMHGYTTLREETFLDWKQGNKFGQLVYERMYRNVLETAARIIHSDYTRRKLVNATLDILKGDEKELTRLLSNKRIPSDLIRNVRDAGGQKNSSGYHYALSACRQVRRKLDDFLLSMNSIEKQPIERAGKRGRRRQKVRLYLKDIDFQDTQTTDIILKQISEWNTRGFPFNTPQFRKKTTEFTASTENSTGQGYWFIQDPVRQDEIILFIKTPPGVTQKERVPDSPYRNQTLRFRFLNWLPRKAKRARKKAEEALKQGDMERGRKLAFRASQFEEMSNQLLNTIKLHNLSRELALLRVRKEGTKERIQQIKKEISLLKDSRRSAPPTLRASGNRVTLLIPFLPPDEKLLKESLSHIERKHRAGVDRGLRYPVVVSIQHKEDAYVERKIGLDELYKKRERLRQQARVLLSQIARKRNNWEKKHPGLQIPSQSLKKEREMESVWQKVRRLDKEISHQVASETTWFCEHYGVKTIYFEDLRTFQGKGGMRTHSWNLSTNLWGLMIDGVTYRRMILGHKRGGVWTVNPAWTSQKCHKCGEVGVRVEKTDSTEETKGGEYFYCESCGLSIHADVNAARNILEVQQSKPSAVSGRTS